MTKSKLDQDMPNFKALIMISKDHIILIDV